MMKLLCDQMLGTLAKWLRIIGFDTYYATATVTDDELLTVAEQEQRVLISRDTDLIYRARRRTIRTIHLTSTDLDDQLASVLMQVPVDTQKILSRCSICNSKLHTIDKTTVKTKVPHRIFTSHNQFWYCSACDKVYWHGSHYESMKEKLQQINIQVESSEREESL